MNYPDADPVAPMTRAARLLQRTLVWDNHGCMPVSRPLDTSFLPQLQRYRAAGVNVAMINVGFGEMGIEEHVRILGSMRHWLKARPNEYVLIRETGDIERAQRSNRLAVGFDIEGANAIGDQLGLIELYYDLGVRWMLLAYNLNNRVGGGCQDNDTGLTPFGREVVREMERVGMQVCCSHTGHRTVRDVLKIATRPVIFSHSNASAIRAHPRNIPDDLILACAATGGVVCINGIGDFVGDNDNSSGSFARHVDHVAKLAGIDHVGIGLDFVFDTEELDQYVERMRQTFPEDMGYRNGVRMVAPEQLESIVDALFALNYGEGDIAKVLGSNLLRVAQSVWK